MTWEFWHTFILKVCFRLQQGIRLVMLAGVVWQLIGSSLYFPLIIALFKGFVCDDNGEAATLCAQSCSWGPAFVSRAGKLKAYQAMQCW